MAAIVPADWSVDSATKNIRYIGDDHLRFGGTTPSYAEVIELHRWLQDLADDPTWSGNDEISIAETNPSSRSTDNIITLLNGYNIDDNAAEHLFDGSIIQSGGDIIYDGFVNFGNSDVSIQLIQAGTKIVDDWWNLDPGTGNAGGGLNADAAQGVSHRFMVKVRDAGADIDGRKIIGTTRTFGKTYGEFVVNSTSRGNNVLALSDSNDLNNNTLEATVATWTTIANVTEGFALIDVSGDGTPEEYYSEWNKDIYSINQFYERMKYLTRDGSAETLYGLDGEDFRGITHQVELNTGGTNSGTFSAFEAVSWTGGTGQMLAIDNTTAASANTMWIQLLTGSAPSPATLITGGTSGATATTAAAAQLTSRTVSTPFVGSSTGSAIIGAYGVGIEAADLTAADQLFDLGDNPISPPNNVQFTVGGLVSGEDYVLVAPWDGTTTDGEGNPAINKTQMSLQTTLNTNNVTSIVTTGAPPAGTPTSGTIRVTDDAGNDRRLTYSDYTTGANTTWTITTVDGNEDFLTTNATAGNGVWLSYIDTLAGSTGESYTAVHTTDVDLVVIVRDGGVTPIVQFISSATFTSSATTITAIRTSDV